MPFAARAQPPATVFEAMLENLTANSRLAPCWLLSADSRTMRQKIPSMVLGMLAPFGIGSRFGRSIVKMKAAARFHTLDFGQAAPRPCGDYYRPSVFAAEAQGIKKRPSLPQKEARGACPRCCLDDDRRAVTAACRLPRPKGSAPGRARASATPSVRRTRGSPNAPGPPRG